MEDNYEFLRQDILPTLTSLGCNPPLIMISSRVESATNDVCAGISMLPTMTPLGDVHAWTRDIFCTDLPYFSTCEKKN